MPRFPIASPEGGIACIPEEHDQLVIALRAAAQGLAHRRSIRDLEETLGQIVSVAVDTIPSVDAGSISMTEDGRIDTRHPTSENIRKLDETQSELHEGPCITAIEDPPDSGIIVAQDLAGRRCRALAALRAAGRRRRLSRADVDLAVHRRRRPWR